MFFTKYARAIDDTRERKTMRALYIARWVFLGLTAFCLIVLLAAASLAGEIGSDGENMMGIGVAFIVILIIIGCLIATAINVAAHVIITVVFAVKFDKICKRPQTDGETPAVYGYRTEYVKERASARKYTGWASAVFILSAAVLVALILYDVLFAETESSVYFQIGAVVFAAGAVTYFLAVYLKSVKDASNGKTFAMRVEEYTVVIDELQGRPHKYSASADKNAQNTDLLYPDEKLRARAQALSRKNATASIVTTCVAIVLYFAAVVVENFVIKSGYIGYYFPAFFAAVCIVSITVSLCLNARAKKLDVEQENLLRADPELASNLELFEMYKRFGKRYGSILPVFVAIGIAIGFVLAAFFPSSYLSLLSVIAPIVGLIVYTVAFNKLRTNAVPLENAIRAKTATAETEGSAEENKAEEE